MSPLRPHSPSKRALLWLCAGFFGLGIGGALAQWGPLGGFGPGGFRRRPGMDFSSGGGFQWVRGMGREMDPPPPPRQIFPADSFTFCRIQFTGEWTLGQQDGQDWYVDSPQADKNLSLRLSQTTTIRINHDANGDIQRVEMPFTDPELGKYPIAFITEPGAMVLDDAEQKAARSYLLRGGFLIVDDFHGDIAWANVAREFNNVLPSDEYPIVDIPMSHPIFHIVFPIGDKIPQVPSIHFYGDYLQTGDTVEYAFGHPYDSGDTRAHCKGIFDKKGRLMCTINFNTDLGDGWQEEGKNEGYFREFSARKAFPMGINMIAYAMTH